MNHVAKKWSQTLTICERLAPQISYYVFLEGANELPTLIEQILVSQVGSKYFHIAKFEILKFRLETE